MDGYVCISLLSGWVIWVRELKAPLLSSRNKSKYLPKKGKKRKEEKVKKRKRRDIYPLG